jgi:hypothetical protein
MRIVFLKFERFGDKESVAVRVDRIEAVAPRTAVLKGDEEACHLFMCSGCELLVLGTVEATMKKVVAGLKQAFGSSDLVVPAH